MMGATVVGYHYEGRFVPKDHLKLLEKYKVTTFCAPPTVWRLLFEDASAYKLSLRQVVSAGEPLNPEVIASWKSNPTGLIIRDGFGQTEIL